MPSNAPIGVTYLAPNGAAVQLLVGLRPATVRVYIVCGAGAGP